MSLKPGEILVVDLDGTLLRSDMLFEKFGLAFGRDWRSPFLSVAALNGGPASMKRHLAIVPLTAMADAQKDITAVWEASS